MRGYPTISRDLPTWSRPSMLFLDLEYSGERPTVLGVSSGARAHSVPWGSAATSWLLPNLLDPQVQIAGHAILTADKPILEGALGIKIPWSRFQDSMLWHYLCNAELCKGVAKGGEEEDDEEGPRDTRGAGFMDLWTFASLYTTLPNWKWPWNCSDPGSCANRPCPRHSPYWYNGLDALGLDVGWPFLMADAERKRIPRSLYDHLARLTIQCDQMTRRGILVDREHVARIATMIETEKDKIFPSHEAFKVGKRGQVLTTKETLWDAPFNPRSPKQVLAWFESREVFLGSTDKDDIALALDRTEPGTEAHIWLQKLYDHKSVGKGAGPWLSGDYVDSQNLLHPRFITTASSLGRLTSSGPNFQNIPAKGRLMSRLRECIVAQPGYNLVTADAKQLELRKCLHCAGVTRDFGADAFTWLVQEAPELFEEATRLIDRPKWTARDTAKSVVHGGNYGEGLVLFKRSALSKGRIKDMVDRGVIHVFQDWEYGGEVVCNSGVNLSERLFKKKSWENRRKGLQIQEALYGRFSELRTWQRRVSQQIEENGYVRSVSGRYLDLSCYPDPIDRLKIGLAFYGQGEGADYIQDGMLQYEAPEDLPLFQVHDELAWERPVDEPLAKTLELTQRMAGVSERMGGFSCPVDVKIGGNWGKWSGENPLGMRSPVL